MSAEISELGLAMDLEANDIFVDGIRYRISSLMAEFAQLVMAAYPRVASYDHILTNVWPVNEDMTPRAAHSLASRLRCDVLFNSKVADLETIQGRGYRFIRRGAA